MTQVMLAGLLLALGTYTVRRAGVQVGDKVHSSARAARAGELLDQGVVALLIAVTVSAALYEGGVVDGWARPIGVGLALGSAALRWPLLVSVLIGAATTAGLRLLGVA